MEDRKRSAVSSADELAPPSKRVAINGSKAKEEPVDMREELWVDDFRKEAILRQMKEYKRKFADAESRLDDLRKRCVYDEDQLRIIHAWCLELVERVQLMADGTVTNSIDSSAEPPYLTSVSFKDDAEFEKHLQEKERTIVAKLEPLLAKLAASRDKLPHDVAKMEAKISKLLASEKAFATKLDRLNTEKEELSEQLNAATLRYFKAEKKLDRAKSTQVQKLEQQAFANATRPAGASNNSNDGGAEAKKEETNGNHSEILLKYEEATAAATKQKQQLDSLLAEIRTIQEENTNLKARREAWSDEDLVRSDIFKQFKLQNEDLIKRINNVEASNKQLREEAETMRADRSAFRAQLEADANQVTQELEAEIVARDQDLARVRSARDEILAENTQRKASMDQEKAAIDQIKELAAAKDERISALESEISRLKPADDVDMAETDDGAELPVDELRAKYKKLQVDFRSINQELPSIEKAYRKMKDLAQRKVTDFAALEERVAVLIAEKSKADQKYFAARKDADTRNNEIRSLRHQNSKSAEIIAQLKDHEAQNRSLLGNLEKQLSDLRQANATLVTDNKRVESAHQEAVRLRGSLSKQVADLTGLVKAKDAAAAQVRERNAAHETESEKLKVRLETMTKDRDNWKSKALSNSSEEEEMLRTFALCTICRNNFKNTALKTCGHLFCNKCIEDRISNRMRKCPTCSRSFDKMDVMAVHA